MRLEVELSGEVLADLQMVAEDRGWSVADVVRQTLHEGLQRPLVLADEEPQDTPGLRVTPPPAPR